MEFVATRIGGGGGVGWGGGGGGWGGGGGGGLGGYIWLGVIHQISNIRSTKSQNLNVSRLVLKLFLPNPLKPGVASRMKI